MVVRSVTPIPPSEVRVRGEGVTAYLLYNGSASKRD